MRHHDGPHETQVVIVKRRHIWSNPEFAARARASHSVYRGLQTLAKRGQHTPRGNILIGLICDTA